LSLFTREENARQTQIQSKLQKTGFSLNYSQSTPVLTSDHSAGPMNRRNQDMRVGDRLLLQINNIVKDVMSAHKDEKTNEKYSNSHDESSKHTKHSTLTLNSNHLNPMSALSSPGGRPALIRSVSNSGGLMPQLTNPYLRLQNSVYSPVNPAGNSQNLSKTEKTLGEVEDSSINPSSNSATNSVKIILDYYRNNNQAREELEQRVERTKQHKLSQTKHFGEQLKKNKELAANYSPDYVKKLRRNIAERDQNKRKLAEQRKLAADLANSRANDGNSMQLFTTEQLKRIAAEKERKFKLQRVQVSWLMMTKLIPITNLFQNQLISSISHRIEAETQEFVTKSMQEIYQNSITWQYQQRKAQASEVLRRSIGRWACKWRFRRNRRLAGELWKFLTLVKTMTAIRSGLRESSVRSQIVKLQCWWRIHYSVIKAQRNLIEIKWNRRENIISKQAMRLAGDMEQLNKGESAAIDGLFTSRSHHNPTEIIETSVTMEQNAINKAERGKTKATAPASSNSSTNLSLKAPNSPGHGTRTVPPSLKREKTAINRGIDLSVASHKQIPKQQRRETVNFIVAKRRAQYRAVLRFHFAQVAQFLRVHAHDIELSKARLELGISSERANIPQPPRRPTFKLIPSNSEIDAAINNAAKAFYLTKLNQQIQENSLQSNRNVPGQQLSDGSADNSLAVSPKSPYRFQSSNPNYDSNYLSSPARGLNINLEGRQNYFSNTTSPFLSTRSLVASPSNRSSSRASVIAAKLLSTSDTNNSNSTLDLTCTAEINSVLSEFASKAP
jgi:hypothetical protein